MKKSVRRTLKFLTKNKGIVYSIEQIYKNVWEDECYGAENIIAVHIRHIREKIEINPKEPKYLKINKELYSLLEWNSEQVINKEKYLRF